MIAGSNQQICATRKQKDKTDKKEKAQIKKGST